MPYRDELDHLRRRLATVQRDLDEVRHKTSALEELRQQQRGLEEEAGELERELGARERRRTLPVLDDVRVASPCEASWEDMVGDERKRFCTQCARHVFNLSALTRGEAEALVQGAGELCVRFYRRADGTLLTADCPVGLRRRRRRWVAFSALAVGLLGSAAMFLGSRTMGAIAPVEVLGGLPASSDWPVKAQSTTTARIELSPPVVTVGPSVSASAPRRAPSSR